jgi:hypothetical protein
MFSTIGFVVVVVSGRVVVGNGVVAFVGKGLAGVAARVNVLIVAVVKTGCFGRHKSETFKGFRMNHFRNLSSINYKNVRS